MPAEKIKKYTKEDYYALPENTRVELINGVIFDMSPAPLRIHQKISMKISQTIGNFIDKNGGDCEVYTAPFDVELSEDTVVQPDISVICDKNKLTKKGCTGAPDWIIEITSSNAINDYIYKLEIYQRYGVKEYWIVDPRTNDVSIYYLVGELFTYHYKFSDSIPVGIYKGKLEINIDELLK
ncbi:MAG: Uma2 family endonuclease [Acutalibacteraceae bacterium]